ncbi:GNAT family N-acetyltransferase [Streptomyces sp. ISL-98]|uniref:GNAT family N-acetyltransferase n=1 Tax=Streptomyces sp. ISL-98 TaxID=2819192 RepID=UPI001BE8FEA3|nr:GNAT family N-acetyltransferase [Streptomyces sp. ISL-98]MBT2511465.1 GNAT family N-acetyltransferase [Streptomyces sp. ISL-98]
MTVQLGKGITLEGYDVGKTQDVASLRIMYTDYLLEEFERIKELAFGNPVADYLTTMFIQVNGENAGFLSLDPNNYAVEVIYVKPDFRHRGLATLALQETNRNCPVTLSLKTPLSPGGEALADQLGLDLARNFPGEEARNQEALLTIAESVRAACRHKQRSGDPRKLCPRCYRLGLRRYADRVIDKHM